MTKTKNNTLNVFDKFIASLRKLYKKKYDNPIEIYTNLGKIKYNQHVIGEIILEIGKYIYINVFQKVFFNLLLLI